MSSDASSVIGRLRNPAHTGENRCWPCTVVNGCLTLALAGVAALFAVELAAVVAAVGTAAIALRGYLVPGTPTLTKRYLPERVLRAFGKQPEYTEPDDFETLRKLEYERENAVDEDAFLREVGAATGASDGDDLTDEFADALAEELAGLPDTLDEPLAATFGTQPSDVTIDLGDHPAVTVGNRMREWPTESSLRTDAAAHQVLAAWADEWLDVPLEQRVDMLKRLRSFSRTCPACGGAVARTDETVVSCCGIHEVKAVACTDCGERLAERDPKDRAGKLAS